MQPFPFTMRYITILGALLAFFAIHVSAQCTCVSDAVEENQCANSNDFSCLCQSNYLFSLQTCFALSVDCTNRQLSAAVSNFYKGCGDSSASATESSFPTETETTTPTPTNTDTDTVTPTPTSTDDPKTQIATSSPTATPTHSQAPALGGSAQDGTATKLAAPAKSSSKPVLSKGAIGGIVGAGIGVIAVGVGVGLLFLARRYKKKDAIMLETNTKEVEHFIEEGRRKPSAALSGYSPSSRAPSGSFGDRTPLAAISMGGTTTRSSRSPPPARLGQGLDEPLHEHEEYDEPPSPPRPPPPPPPQPQPHPQLHPLQTQSQWPNNHSNPTSAQQETQPLSPGSYNRHEQVQQVHSPDMSFHPQGYY